MIVSRFAPSPTGPLHLGHAFSAVIAHRAAREAGGHFLLRIEDLDPGRSRPEHVDAIFADLRWLDLDWDGEPVVQSRRAPAYAHALDRLRALGLVYPCYCTRSDIVQAIAAPHGPSGHTYPGTCRGLPDDPGRRAAQPHSWRLDSARAVARTGLPSWTEQDGQIFRSETGMIDDVVLARKDALSSYHLACVVDDCASGVSLVVRGMDLRSSTPVQRLLQDLLGLPQPTYRHHALVEDANGARLAKRDRAPTLRAMREAGVDGPALAAGLAMDLVPSGFRLRKD